MWLAASILNYLPWKVTFLKLIYLEVHYLQLVAQASNYFDEKFKIAHFLQLTFGNERFYFATNRIKMQLIQTVFEMPDILQLVVAICSWLLKYGIFLQLNFELHDFLYNWFHKNANILPKFIKTLIPFEKKYAFTLNFQMDCIEFLIELSQIKKKLASLACSLVNLFLICLISFWKASYFKKKKTCNFCEGSILILLIWSKFHRNIIFFSTIQCKYFLN